MKKSTLLLSANFLQFIGISMFISFLFMLFKLPVNVSISGYIVVIVVGIIIMSLGIVLETKNNEARILPFMKIILISLIFIFIFFISDDIIEKGLKEFLYTFFWAKVLIIPLIFCAYFLINETTTKEITLFLFLVLIGILSFILPSIYYPKTLIIHETKLTDDNWRRLNSKVTSICKKVWWNWSGRFQECLGIDEPTCDKIGGTFNECASACRNDPKAEGCTSQCVQICKMNI